MTAKEYLLEVRRIWTRLDAMSEQLVFLRSAAQYAVPCLSDMPKPQRNIYRAEDAYIKVIEKEEQIKTAEVKLTEVIATIDSVVDPDQHAVLVKRYLSNKTWEEISAELYISRSHVFTLHNAALVEIEKAIKKAD